MELNNNNIQSADELKLKIELDSLYNVWKQFCENHTVLYELTCDEYIKLLASELEELDQVMTDKNEVLATINLLDEKRKEIISNVCHLMKIDNPEKIKDFIILLKENNREEFGINLEKINLLLVAIIQKIQEQNKKNQLFLNKAILSLKELRGNFQGKKSYSTYGPNGLQK